MHLDTHTIVWLYDSGPTAFPRAARRLLDDEPLAISPMVELELALLHEVGRVAPSPGTIVTGLQQALGLTTSPASFISVVHTATALTWTRDPFDRLICAHAIADNTTLLTKDRKIRQNLDRARWD